MKYAYSLFFVTAFLCSVAFAQSQAQSREGDVLATVGDHKITRKMLDHIVATIPEENRVPFLTPDGRKKILDEVVSFMLFAEAAKAEGIDKEPEVQTRLDYVQTEYLAREFFRRRLLKAPPVLESELKKYYTEHLDEFKPPEEIKARHILVRTEAEAKKILKKIESGEDFAQLAKKHSIDPAAAKGGMLMLPDGKEWLPKGTFEKSFEYTLFKIPKGEVGGPIKTQFGWHILKVEDRRQPETPGFVQVRTMIKNSLQDKKNAQIHKETTEELNKKIPVTLK